MDAKLIVDVLRIAGLPGVVIIGWAIATVAGHGDNLLVWGLMVLASVIVNFTAFQFKSFMENMNTNITSTLTGGINSLLDIFKSMMVVQSKMVDELSALKQVYEGGLTLRQLKFILPKLFDTFKWRVFQICHNTIDSKGVFERTDMQDTVFLQVVSILKSFVEYNSIMSSDVIQTYLKDSVDKVFVIIYSAEFMQIDDQKQKTRMLIEAIRREFDACALKVLEFLDDDPSSATNSGIKAAQKLSAPHMPSSPLMQEQASGGD